jgi:SPW repeat
MEPLWNSVIIGIAVIVLAIWSGSATVMEHRERPA